MNPFERAWAFDCILRESAAARVERFDYGAAVHTDALPRVYDANFVRLDAGLEDMAAPGAERLTASLQAHLRHRKLFLPPAGERLAGELAARGWSVNRIVVMAYAGPSERDGSVAARAELVEPRAIRAARQAALSGRDAEIKDQLADYTERLVNANDGRVFAAFEDGEVASFCTLFERDGVGEIDEVTALERFRGRGLGSAVVEAALQASLAGGNDLTFLNADADDWPARWYERLGFRRVAMTYEAYRTV
jgi:ribosomal protein S18 acetylase RimI-like enzyme